MKNKFIALIVVLVIVGGAWDRYRQPDQITNTAQQKKEAAYNPMIVSTDFVSTINNPYFTLLDGAVFNYESKSDQGLEKTIIEVTGETKIIDGINTTVVRDRVWLDDQIIEDTKDLFAQDKDGNVWYFGEAVDNYENGKLTNHQGSWESGVDEAKPGIVMSAEPKVGDSYRQEYYLGQAEDRADIVAIGESVSVPAGTYTNCVKTREWSMLEPDLNEYKFYCPNLGWLALELAVSGNERVELTSFSQLPD